MLLYEFFEFTNPSSSAVSFPSYPALSFTLPSTYVLAAGDYYLAYFNGSSWQRPITGVGTIVGQTISFAPPAGAPTFNANTTYAFALYYQPFAAPSPAPVVTAAPTSTPTAAPTATPSPGASPTPTPTPGALSASPPSLSFGSLGTSQQLTITQANANPTFTVNASSCQSTVAGTPAYVSVTGTSPTFTVTSNAVGTCSLVVTGAANQTLTIPVTVSTLSVGVQ